MPPKSLAEKNTMQSIGRKPDQGQSPTADKKRKADTQDPPSKLDKKAKKIQAAKSADAFAGTGNLDEQGGTPEERYQKNLPKLEAQRAHDIAAAKKDDKFTAPLGEYGVFVAADMIEKTTIPKMAGYLACPSTNVLWERFHENEMVWKMLKGLSDEYEKKTTPILPYDLNITAPSIVKATLFKHLTLNKFHRRDVVGSHTPPQNLYPLREPLRMYLYLLRVAHLVIAAVPDSFPGPALPAVSRKYVEGLFEAEDLCRFLILFQGFVRVATNKTEGKKARSDGLPRLPLFCLAEEKKKNTEYQQALNRMAFDNLQTQNRLKQILDNSSAPDDNDPEVALDSVDKCLHQVKLLHRDLPDLEGDDQRILLKAIADKVTYLYRDRQNMNTFFAPPAPTLPQTLRDTFQENATSKALSKAEQAVFDKGLYAQLQQSINDCSAKAPDWRRVVDELNLDIQYLDPDDDDDVDHLTNQKFRVIYRKLQLMPWQPQAAVFMLDMINGPLHACINADDMGLGKTVSTLLVIVERSIRVQAELDKWYDKYNAILAPFRRKSPAAMHTTDADVPDSVVDDAADAPKTAASSTAAMDDKITTHGADTPGLAAADNPDPPLGSASDNLDATMTDAPNAATTPAATTPAATTPAATTPAATTPAATTPAEALETLIADDINMIETPEAAATEAAMTEVSEVPATEAEDEAAIEEEIIATYGLQAEVAALGPKPRHRPVLVTVPPSAVSAWMSDAGKFFSDALTRCNVTVKTFFGVVGSRGSSLDRELSVGVKAADLTAWCNSLSTDDENTSRSCILSTFRSFSNRCLTPHVGDGVATSSAVLIPEEAQAEADDEDAEVDEDDDTAGDDSFFEGAATTLQIPCDLFALVVIDEAHRVKNPNSLQTRALYSLSDCAYILCTATPCINSVRDFYGLLRFLWKDIAETMEGKTRPDRKSYKNFAHNFRTKYDRDLLQMDEKMRNLYLPALDPAHFRSLIGSGAVGVDVGYDIVPLPFMMTCLRRVMGHQICIEDCIIQLGADIPPPQICITELRWDDVGAGLYGAAHHDSVQKSSGNTNDEGDEQRPFSVRRRRLQHATLNPQLEQMFKRNVGNQAWQIDKFFQSGIDSFDLYYTFTKSDPHHPMLDTRIAMALYITGVSPKLQALCAEILQVIVNEDRKMLIYADWPLNLWIIEVLLSVLQINYRSIRAGVSTNKRVEAENEYNTNPAVKALICSSRSAAESLNLQQGGWHTVILDLVPMNILLQIVGRACRVGQRFTQQIKIFVIDETYDQYLLHKYFGEYNTQVAATSRSLIPLEEQERIEREVADREGTSLDKESYMEACQQSLRDEYAGALARSIFGGRCTLTEEWANVQDVYAKNLHPEQQLFRLASGAAVANEMLQLLHNRKKEQEKQEQEKKEQEEKEQEKRAQEKRAQDGSEQAIGEEETGQQQATDQERTVAESKTEATLTHPPPIAHRTTPFAAPMIARPVNRGGFSERKHVRALIHAAEDMAKQDAHRFKGITAEQCLQAAKTWVISPSKHIESAIAQLARTDDTDAGWLSDTSTVIAEPAEGSKESVGKRNTRMVERPKALHLDGASSGDAEGEIGGEGDPGVPQSVDALSDEQRNTWKKHLAEVRDLSSRQDAINFALQEFEGTARSRRRSGVDSEVALLWLQKEINDSTPYNPDWSKYRRKGTTKSKGKKKVDDDDNDDDEMEEGEE